MLIITLSDSAMYVHVRLWKKKKKGQKYYECLQGGLEWMKNVWSCSSAKSGESVHPLYFDFWVWVDPNHKEKRKQRWSRHRERSFWNLALKCKSSQSLLSPRIVKQLERTGKSLHGALRCRGCFACFFSPGAARELYDFWEIVTKFLFHCSLP